MSVYQFGVRVMASRPSDQAGLLLGRCADAVVESGPGARRVVAYFDRAARSLAGAVVAAVRDLEASGMACLSVVSDDDLVTAGAVAARLRLSRRVVGGMLHGGPPPVHRCTGEAVYRWSEIAPRLRAASDPRTDRTMEALNLALRVRVLVRGDPALAAAVRDLLAG